MSSPVLIDTNIVSYIFKRDTRALPYLQKHLDGKLWIASFMTLAELQRWAIRYQWGETKRGRLEPYLSRYTIIPYDAHLCNKWAEVMEAGRRTGRTIEHSDAWIAATALLYNLPLVTHNAKHFAGLEGLEILTV